HDVARRHEADVAVEALRRVEEGGGGARRDERARDLLGDLAGLADAAEDHAPGAREDPRDGVVELGPEAPRERRQRLRLTAGDLGADLAVSLRHGGEGYASAAPRPHPSTRGSAPSPATRDGSRTPP